MTREQWLNDHIDRLKPMFKEIGYDVPEKVRVSIGWPSVRALSKKNTRIGECWPALVSKDRHTEIFISPILEDETEVIGVLIHELCHATLGPGTGHGKEFGKIARGMGLEGKLTATHVGDGLKGRLNDEVIQGKYPGAAMRTAVMNAFRKRQTTRMIRAECEECGYVIRTTRKWIEQVGLPTCACGGEFKGKG